MNEESLLLILMLESLTGVRSRMHNNLSPTPPYVKFELTRLSIF
ncbi:hypothetical protein HanXRQr2_Chr14g0640281 [Helianthus annuus]|uniref:Uncharacterized protein n=1 Tax=Helianthus annuus TaxID=4232 RepID=A0A9K3EAC6_HELAN|nr:hypothetical protein HanXRQr2_Chr14g0640281 [Helianthus annuus]